DAGSWSGCSPSDGVARRVWFIEHAGWREPPRPDHRPRNRHYPPGVIVKDQRPLPITVTSVYVPASTTAIRRYPHRVVSRASRSSPRASAPRRLARLGLEVETRPVRQARAHDPPPSRWHPRGDPPRTEQPPP